LDVFETLVNPNRDISNSHIHGVSASMVAGAPSFDEIASDVAQLIDGAVLVAHNLPFDARMLKSEFSRIGVQPNFGSGIDTLAATSLRLLDACEHFDIQLTGHHSARADAVATAELFVMVAGACGSGSPASVIAPTTPTGRRLTRGAVAGGGEIGLSGSDIAAAHRRFVNEAFDRVLLDGVVEDDESCRTGCARRGASEPRCDDAEMIRREARLRWPTSLAGARARR
jgi:DNA polymerase III epsilon subunit-like protein